jgi:hypothetical protein
MDNNKNDNLSVAKNTYQGYYDYVTGTNSKYNAYTIIEFCNNGFRPSAYWINTSNGAESIIQTIISNMYISARAQLWSICFND